MRKRPLPDVCVEMRAHVSRTAVKYLYLLLSGSSQGNGKLGNYSLQFLKNQII